MADFGIPEPQAVAYYKEVRNREFWIDDLIAHFNLPEVFYKKLTDPEIIKKFIYTNLLDTVKLLGKENCIILTHGSKKWQLDKIVNSGIAENFSRILVVYHNKKEELKKLCLEFRDEQILFIDNDDKYFQDLNSQEFLNLKTLLYTGQDLNYLADIKPLLVK
jgi:FMN phosphatase YigB (HAD superfamily)